MYWPQTEDSAVPRPASVTSTHSGSNVSTKASSSRGKNDICVGEELKIAVNIALERFRLSEEQKELEFPSSFTSTERAYVHKLCLTYGLKSKSRGKKANRYVSVMKKDAAQSTQLVATFHLVRNSRQTIHSLLQRFPLTTKERQELQQRLERNQYNEGLAKEMGKAVTGRLNNGLPQVPPAKLSSELASFQQSLPIYQMKDVITKAINDNRVLMISGETGSGKTTQVPQMILDDSHAQKRPCRIFCTQPRRLSALSIAERVAAERGEKIGETVGYQIRLESKVSPKTLLTFCTNGVLLRTLMAGEQSLSTVTHIIVDEIHERDRFSDFLLIVLRELLPRLKMLKVILMSAALNVQLFYTYFGGCPVLTVPGQMFDVQEYFLEDVLKWTSYTNKDMEKYKLTQVKSANQQQQLNDWCSRQLPNTSTASAEPISGAATEEHQTVSLLAGQDCTSSVEVCPEKEELEAWIIKDMDRLLGEAWLTGNEDIFQQIFHLILNENVSVDYVHSETTVTALMVAAGRGFFGTVEQLLNIGANVSAVSSNEWTALDWARQFEQHDVTELLETHLAAIEEVTPAESLLIKQSSVLSAEDRDLLACYHHGFDDEKVDIDLIICLLYAIHSQPREGAILVFLPGYDEIIMLRDRIQDEKRFSDSSRYILFTLHSQMQSTDQRRVFQNAGPGVRKIILSTNIAETSITINDVVFVVDSGKVKEKSYDALTSVSMLKSRWISKASSQQRKGRAGRCQAGVCYHLFSRVRYNGMQEFQDPEILRHPLQELCLHTKLLAPVNTLIADFLAKAPDPPAFLLTRNAVHILKQIDALDPFEDLTELGHHLADLPVEPRYGKMILYSVVLKCLDPILTIACALAYKDPFVLPTQPYQKRAAAMSRRRFAAGTNSDHMALLRAFQGWQKAKSEGWERSFCERNMLSSPTMEMIVGMRTQLLGQLRASGFVRARGGGDIRDLNSNSENWAVVKAALCAGLYPNILRVDRERNQLTSVRENKVRFHSASALGPAPNEVGPDAHLAAVNRLPTDWLAYDEMTRLHRSAQVKSCTIISPVTIAMFAGPAKLPLEAVKEAECGLHCEVAAEDGSLNNSSSDSDGDNGGDGDASSNGVRRATLRLDDWLVFRVDAEAAALVMQLRQKWHSLFLRRMRAPTKPWSQFDESTVRSIVSVMTNEELALGLQQPAGIGQRPRPMSTETVISSGGSRIGSADSDQLDDTSASGVGTSGQLSNVASFLPSARNTGSYHKKSHLHRSNDDRSSEASSVRSSASGNDSLPGSAASSPCESPQPSSLKWGEGDAGAASSHHCRYFVIKAANNKMLQTAEQKGMWGTTSANEKKIAAAFADGKTVVLIFTVHGSSQFNGVARVTNVVPVSAAKEFLAPGVPATLQLDWWKKSALPFQYCNHLNNLWSDNKKVISSKDGQELEPSVAEQLLSLWNKLPMPGVPPQPTRSVPGVQSFAAPGHYLPSEYATTPFNQRSRQPHPANQYPGWAQLPTGVGPQPFNQWGMMAPHRHGYPGPFPQDFAAMQHLQSQFGYSLPQQMSKNYPSGMYPSAAGHHQPSSTNPSVMILQRSAGSDSPAGK